MNNDLELQEVKALPVAEDPFFGLKKDLINFFSNRMNEIKAKDAIQKRIIEKFADMLEMDDLSFEQLMAIYRTVSSDSRSSTDSLLAIFRPTPGVESPFAANISRNDEKQDAFEKIYENMTSEDLENIDTLLKLMKVVNKQKDNDEE